MTRYYIGMAAKRKKNGKPNCIASLVTGPNLKPPPLPDPPPPPTPEEQAKSDREWAAHKKKFGTVFRKGSIDIQRSDGTWVLDYGHEYTTELTRADLRKLRDALNAELGDG